MMSYGFVETDSDQRGVVTRLVLVHLSVRSLVEAFSNSFFF